MFSILVAMGTNSITQSVCLPHGTTKYLLCNYLCTLQFIIFIAFVILVNLCFFFGGGGGRGNSILLSLVISFKPWLNVTNYQILTPHKCRQYIPIDAPNTRLAIPLIEFKNCTMIILNFQKNQFTQFSRSRELDWPNDSRT